MTQMAHHVAARVLSDAQVGSWSASAMGSSAEDDGVVAVTLRQVDQYRIVVRKGAASGLPDLVRSAVERRGTRDFVLVTDSRIPKTLVSSTLEGLSTLGPTKLLTIANGERSKSLDCAVALLDQLHRLGVERRTAIVALGGGVVCDLAGLLAALYMRGIPYVSIPTSLVAQVDGAIGGKVGVDAFGAKNVAGAFYHPSLVVVDPDLLLTLPQAEFANGLAEVVKVAVIASPELFETLERLDISDSRLPSLVGDIVEEAVTIKLELLADDPTEVTTLDRHLNFGHCVGHSLEAVTGFAGYRHGEAVAVGMSFGARLGALRGVCPPEVAERIVNVLAGFGLPTMIPAALAPHVWNHLRVIRRIRNGRLRVVIPQRIGQCAVLPDIGRSEFEQVTRLMHTA